MSTLNVRMKPYIQPFERVLALQELKAISGVDFYSKKTFEEITTDFKINSLLTPKDIAHRLAYWEVVKNSTSEIITTQSLRESTVNLVRNGVDIEVLNKQLPFGKNVPLPNRRCLRYGTHGIHEYRGKFFPQLVRSLINISNVKPGMVVADPMSGSGTTVVESLLSGCRGVGLDMNPLSIFIGNVKANLLSANPSSLMESYKQIRNALLAVEDRAPKPLKYLNSLPDIDQQYLRSWFSEDVLIGLDDISQAIQQIEYDCARDFMRVSLSNILRSVSWQKDDDLRVRKDIRLDKEIDPKKEFLEEFGRSIRAVLAFLFQNKPLTGAKFKISEGDAKEISNIWGGESVDVIITSPPYATALPYLDTDRLSLCYLGLLPRPEHRIRDQHMIGNREISEKIRYTLWDNFEQNGTLLPESVNDLINNINSLNAGISVGFRRRNLPALLAKYFFDMKTVIEGMYDALKPGCLVFMIVGNNHTIAGGQRVDIYTASLLQDIACSIGFEINESISMDMLTSRDIFKKNAMASEKILVFRRPI